MKCNDARFFTVRGNEQREKTVRLSMIEGRGWVERSETPWLYTTELCDSSDLANEFAGIACSTDFASIFWLYGLWGGS